MNATSEELLAELIHFSPGQIFWRAVLWSLLPAALVLVLGVIDRLLLSGAGGAWILFRQRWRRWGGALVVPLALLQPGLALAWWAPWQDLLLVSWVMAAAGAFTSVMAALLASREVTMLPRKSLLPWAGGLLVAGWFCLVLGDGLTRGSRLLTRLVAEEAKIAAEKQQNNSDPRALFEQNCAGCHGVKTKIVGPPLTDIAAIYKENPAGIVAWAKAPGRKRTDGAAMPAMAHVGDEKLAKIADYMLTTGATQHGRR